MTAMRPSNVRRRILDEHRDIAVQLERLEELAVRLDAEGDAAIPDTVAFARDFYEKLREHIDLEDAILAPALREADAWGEVRAGKLEKHHAEQRKELTELGALDARTTDPTSLAGRVRAFIEEIRQDMKHEEEGVLSGDLLRDDLTSIDAEGG